MIVYPKLIKFLNQVRYNEIYTWGILTDFDLVLSQEDRCLSVVFFLRLKVLFMYEVVFR